MGTLQLGCSAGQHLPSWQFVGLGQLAPAHSGMPLHPSPSAAASAGGPLGLEHITGHHYVAHVHAGRRRRRQSAGLVVDGVLWEVSTPAPAFAGGNHHGRSPWRRM